MVDIAFRADASAQMGIGHLMRCMTLALTLRERGARPHFICREHPGNLIALLREQGLPVAALAPPVPRQGSSMLSQDYGQWLGVSQSTDAAQTIDAMPQGAAAWLVVDHYALDSEWESLLRTQTARLMVIDDLADRSHQCDLLLDQNYFDHAEDRYRALVPQRCSLALGPRYALLRPEYARERERLRPRDGRVRRVLVFFGGSDPHDLTGRTLQALAGPDFNHIEVDIVVGANYAHGAALEKVARNRPRTSLSGPRPHLADLMAGADLAIGAGGATTWERMCVGVPSLVVSIADNQRAVCESLAAEGLVRYLGGHLQVSAEDIAAGLRACIAAPEALIEVSSRIRAVVDGLGALRMAECLMPTSTQSLRLRGAKGGDAGLYFHWVNDPEARLQSFRSEPIPWARHREWFAARLDSPESHMLVLLAGTLPVGQIRFDREDTQYRIDYSIEQRYRGRGWASRLVTLGMQHLLTRGPAAFVAEVKASNIASQSVFRRLGFSEASASTDGTAECSVFVFDPARQRLAATS